MRSVHASGLQNDSQCADHEWQGLPLVARYRVDQFTVSERFTANLDKYPVAAADVTQSAELHQLDLSNSLIDSDRSLTASKPYYFQFWREGGITQRIAYQHPELSISEVWNQPSPRLLRRSRHFDKHARAIEFEPSVISPKTESSKLKSSGVKPSKRNGVVQQDVWSQKYYLVSQTPAENSPTLNAEGYSQIEQYVESMAAGLGVQERLALSHECGKLRVVHALRKKQTNEMLWDESLRLPLFIQTINDNSAPIDFSSSASERREQQVATEIRRWTLVSLRVDTAAVQERFANWDGHETTDFADIGDNESDPFLMKMINLGFISHGASGFYDASGKMISSGIGHWHPTTRAVR